MVSKEGIGKEQRERAGIGKGGTDCQLLPFIRGGLQTQNSRKAFSIQRANQDLNHGKNRQDKERGFIPRGGSKGGRHIRKEQRRLEKGKNEAGQGGEGGLVKESLPGSDQTEGTAANEAEDGVDACFEGGGLDGEASEAKVEAGGGGGGSGGGGGGDGRRRQGRRRRARAGGKCACRGDAGVDVGVS